MKVRVDRDVCVAIGNCVAIAPSVFKIDSANKAVVMKVNSVSEEKILSAAKSCPVDAIIVEDDDGQQIYP